MKRVFFLWMSVVALSLVGLSSCNGDLDGVIDTSDKIQSQKGDIYYGLGGKANTGTVGQSDSLAVFFSEELHGVYWDYEGNVHKTFFEQGNYDDEICLTINSREEFQKAYMGTKQLPDVDFENYTLIIGRTWGNDDSYELADIVLSDKDSAYELETRFYHYVDRLAFCAIIHFHYWRLYPKLENKSIVVKRTVESKKD